MADEIAGTHRKTFEGNPHVAVALREKSSGRSEVCYGLEGRAKAEVEDVAEGGRIFESESITKAKLSGSWL